jgi:tRNA-dihydrouridine synthase A
MSNHHINTLSIAPMMDRTDLHFRNLLRLISKNTLLYTEMINTNTIIHDQNNRFDNESNCTGPVALQIGCSDPISAEKATKIISKSNFDEININCGCPSNKVVNGNFGACLMKEPNKVGEIIDAIKKNCTIPVTVKTRIGLENYDTDTFLENFVSILDKKQIDTVIIHARIAILKGLSPHENRTIPPLNFERVKYIKNKFSHMKVIINGGIQNLYEAKILLNNFDGVMIGRAAWDNPWLFSKADKLFYNKNNNVSRLEVINKYIEYANKYIDIGHTQRRLIRPLFNMFYGKQGSKLWKQQLNEIANNKISINSIYDLAYQIEEMLKEAA